jgi:hypothetical protein
MVVLPLVLAACGQLVILKDPTERLVSSFILRKTGVRVRNLDCPSGEPAKVGQTFQCHFTGPDGRYTVDMLVTSIRGTRVEYDIRSHRTS